MVKKTKSTKGADAGTQFAYEKNPHESIETPFGKVPLTKEERPPLRSIILTSECNSSYPFSQ